MNRNKVVFALITTCLIFSTLSVALGDIIIISDPDDLAPPDLIDLLIDPITINTGSEAQAVTFTFHITDELAGFSSGFFWLYSPSGLQRRYENIGSYNRISGDEFDGYYRVLSTFPQYSESGTWYIRQINLIDTVTNTRIIYTVDILDRGLNPYIYVEGGPDLAAPNLIDFDINPTYIDCSTSTQYVTFTFRITDELAGFRDGYFWIYSSTHRQRKYLYIRSYHRISGDANDGIYKCTAVFPEYTESTLWYIRQIVMYDQATNQRMIWYDDLDAMGYNYEWEVFSNPEDIIAPQLESIDIYPTEIDTSIGPQEVFFTFRIIDALAGFLSGYFWLYSPSGLQRRYQYIRRYNLISGDLIDGVYLCSVIMPQYSEVGTWYIRQICMTDNVTNSRCYFEFDFPPDSNYTFDVNEGPQVTPALIDFDPDALNLESRGKFVTVYIELPTDSDYSVYDIDVTTIYLNGIVKSVKKPYEIGDYDLDGIPDLMVKFLRAEVTAILELGFEIPIDINGLFLDGTEFAGTDVIKTLLV